MSPKLSDWLPAGFLLLLFLAQAGFSSLGKAPVGDAWAHYLFGQWSIGEPYSPERMPAWDGTMPVSALNVLFAKAGSRLGGRDAVTVEKVAIPSLFFARLPNMLMGAGLLFALWAFAGTFLNRRTALFALLLGAFEPNLLGHSRFITTDIPAAFGFTVASLCLVAWVLRPSWLSGLSSAALMAVAQLTKTSNLLLYPAALLVIVAAASWRPTRRRIAGRMLAVWLILSFLLLLLALHAGYSAFGEEQQDRLRQSAIVPELGALQELFPVTYRATILIGRAHNQGGHPAYLLGQHGTHGWWHYFPVAILVKTPLPLLLLALIGSVAAARRKEGRLLLAIWPAVLFLAVFCAAVHVNIGVRHVLSVFPALLLLAGYGASSLYEAAKRTRARSSGFMRSLILLLALALPAWAVVEAARIYPHYEGYFNQLAGRPCASWKVLGDSNVAWGQDQWTVEKWARKQNRPVHINPLSPTRGLIAVRADLLAGLTPEMAEQFRWLSTQHEPVGCLTPGILIYDIP